MIARLCLSLLHLSRIQAKETIIHGDIIFTWENDTTIKQAKPHNYIWSLWLNMLKIEMQLCLIGPSIDVTWPNSTVNMKVYSTKRKILHTFLAEHMSIEFLHGGRHWYLGAIIFSFFPLSFFPKPLFIFFLSLFHYSFISFTFVLFPYSFTALEFSFLNTYPVTTV